MAYYGWKPYVPVAKRRAAARREMERLQKKGRDIQPVEVAGRQIATTFWGKAWCDHMESQGDFANRLPRGRTYVRNGSVCHLAIDKGRIQAKVSGSEIYNIDIRINVLSKAKWQKVRQRCGGQIGTLLELLQGRISDSVMEVVTDPKAGLFPRPAEIHLGCDCPDYASMCKHLAAVLYGVGARLDKKPELLFTLRGGDHADLVTGTSDEALTSVTSRGGRRRTVDQSDLADVFDIDLDGEDPPEPAVRSAARSTGSTPRKKAGRKKASPRKRPQTTKAQKKSAKRKGSNGKDPQDAKPAKRKSGKTTGKAKPAANYPTQKKRAVKKSTRKSKATENATASRKRAKGPKQAAKKKGGTPRKAK